MGGNADILDGFGKRITGILRQMDEEADSIINGQRAGIANYANHCGFTGTKYERFWCDHIADVLTKAGLPSETECEYAGCPQLKCDIVTQLADEQPLWLEFKFAWKSWMDLKSGRMRKQNRSYLGYLLGPAADPSRTHSVAQDFDKLEQLHPPEARYSGLILVGFDRLQDPMVPEVEQLNSLVQLQERGWHLPKQPGMLPDRNCPDCRISCWFWWRENQ